MKRDLKHETTTISAIARTTLTNETPRERWFRTTLWRCLFYSFRFLRLPRLLFRSRRRFQRYSRLQRAPPQPTRLTARGRANLSRRRR